MRTDNVVIFSSYLLGFVYHTPAELCQNIVKNVTNIQAGLSYGVKTLYNYSDNAHFLNNLDLTSTKTSQNSAVNFCPY